METKPLLFGLIGFMAGGLLVSVAATTFDKPSSDHMAMTQEVEAMREKTGADFDRAFVDSMVRHHQSAIDMAKLVETRSSRAEIKDLSRDIVAAQAGEINRMKQWQAEWLDTNHSGHRALHIDKQ